MIPTKNEIYEALCVRHTREVQDKLETAHVAIAGLGGLGSTVAVALARAGVGHLHLVDYDRVDITNLNRQQYRMSDIGRYKAGALLELLQQINPYLDIVAEVIRVTPENMASLFAQETIICEAFDQADQKAMLVDTFFEQLAADKILVAASGMGGYGNSNDIITRKINDHFYLCGDESSGLEEGYGLMAPRVGICAAHEANMILSLILDQLEP